MSHDPFAGRRNARRRATNPAPSNRTDAVPGLADEMLAWIDQAAEPGERRQRAKLVIEAEKQTASPRSEVIAAARAVLSQRPPAASGAKRRQPDPGPAVAVSGPAVTVNTPEGAGAEEAREAGKEAARAPNAAAEPGPPTVPEGARRIVAWIRDASGPVEARQRAEAARAAEIERGGTVRPSVQAAIDKVL